MIPALHRHVTPLTQSTARASGVQKFDTAPLPPACNPHVFHRNFQVSQVALALLLASVKAPPCAFHRLTCCCCCRCSPSLIAERIMAKNLKIKGPTPRRGAAKRVVLSAQESKQLLTRTRIRDRVRELLSRSAISYEKGASPKAGKGGLPATALGISTPTPQYQLNLGKRTLLMLQAWKQPRRVFPLQTRPVNRFYVSMLLMIALIGASGSYSYHLASKWYDEVSRQDVVTAFNWEGWVRKVSGKSHAFAPSRKRDQLLVEQAKRAERIAREQPAKPRKTAKAVKSKKSGAGKAKVAHQKKRNPMDELKAWTKRRAPDVESVRVKD